MSNLQCYSGNERRGNKFQRRKGTRNVMQEERKKGGKKTSSSSLSTHQCDRIPSGGSCHLNLPLFPSSFPPIRWGLISSFCGRGSRVERLRLLPSRPANAGAFNSEKRLRKLCSRSASRGLSILFTSHNQQGPRPVEGGADLLSVAISTETHRK